MPEDIVIAEMIDEMDLNKDGKISKHEMMKAFEEQYGSAAAAKALADTEFTVMGKKSGESATYEDLMFMVYFNDVVGHMLGKDD
jgi:hypothetical protein